MKRALLLLPLIAGLAVAEEPRVAAAPPPAPVATPTFSLHVGGQVGFPFLLGVTTRGTFLAAARPRFAVDATWEPSAALQSYSLGGAWHVLDSVFFVGGRVRLVQFQAPWARGGAPLFFGAGLELGVRFRAGADGAVTIALHGTTVPGQANNLSTLVGLSAGFSWGVFSR